MHTQHRPTGNATEVLEDFDASLFRGLVSSKDPVKGQEDPATKKNNLTSSPSKNFSEFLNDQESNYSLATAAQQYPLATLLKLKEYEG